MSGTERDSHTEARMIERRSGGVLLRVVANDPETWMNAALRHLATAMALLSLGATSPAALEAQSSDKAPITHSAWTAAATDGCAQAMVESGDASVPQCPSGPLTGSGPCGGSVALPVESRAQFELGCASDPVGTRREEARDLLLFTPLFRPPIA